MTPFIRCFAVSVGCVVSALLGACQTSLDRANPAAPQPAPAAPEDEATAWTTPETAELPRLGREEPDGQPTRARGTNPWALAYSPGDPTGIDTGIERRLDRYQRGGPIEIYPTLWSTFVVGGDLSDGRGGPDLWDNRVRVSFEKPTDLFGRYAANIQYTAQKYFFPDSNDFIAGTNEPWSLVHKLSVGVNAFQPVHEKWALIASGSVDWSAAEGASLGDGMSWTVTFGGGHRPSSKLDIGAGMIISKSYGNDLFIFGGPQFDWRPDDKWRIALAGFGLDISYRPNETWEIGGAGGFATSRFRLKDELPQAGRIATDSRLPIYIRIRYRGGETSDFQLRLGVDVLRDFDIENRDGVLESSFEADPAFFVGARWIWRL